MPYSITPTCRLWLVSGMLLAVVCFCPIANDVAAQDPSDPSAQSTQDGAIQTPEADTALGTGASVIASLDSVGSEIARGDIGRLRERSDELVSTIIHDFVPRMIGAVVVMIILLIAFRVLEKVLGRAFRRAKAIDAGLEHILLRTYRIVALTFIAVVVLAQFGVNVAALLAGISVAGIAVGFAAQDTVQNYIAGVTILFDKPFRVGDNIEIDGVFGRVVHITLRSTRVQTQNLEIMVMPNVLMINQKLINHTVLETLRVEVPFGIAYKEYPDEARRVVLATTEGDDRLDPSSPPAVVVTQLNNSSVDMCLRVFLKDPKQEIAVRHDYIERVREALRAADIEIPFPHLQLFVDEAKAFENSFIMQRQLKR